ncbi:Type 1 glutamine amidotransferase-like domain-containing protein [Fodinicola acaciae]|uniref:Type 1 glutamine amidotransferase-like domain-containing protein n=1 Tax=Fodinicola acaciae TaxID=2681555 RepID=UPI0013D25995|nr:Type 1 glutamine amidotransferase-like domain-containing protein [Fodinicola acaciae]
MTDQRLFLGSAGLGALPEWLGSKPVRRAVLVPTASNPLPSAPWVDAADRLLRGEGIAVDRLELERAGEADVRRALEAAEVVFVSGGYPLFLLEHANRSGFSRLVPPAVRTGRLGYVGISAGAALAAPDLAYFGKADAVVDPDDPGRPESTRGLELAPFLLLAHRNRGRAARHDREIAASGGQERVSINDDQAVVITGDTWTIVDSP